jgi:hypothetical protein
MPRSTNLSVATMGIDNGKNSFHVVGLDQRGCDRVRQRWTRSQIRADRSFDSQICSTIPSRTQITLSSAISPPAAAIIPSVQLKPSAKSSRSLGVAIKTE